MSELLPGPYGQDVEVLEEAIGAMRDLRDWLVDLSDDERWAVLHAAADGYCWDCGRATDRYGCHCTNDD